jgi:dephospho-CoA kinase
MAHLPLKIGLTGGIAGGKTTVSHLFAQLGVPIIDADTIAHDLVAPGQPVLELISQTFGTDIILSNGQLNRTQLRQRVFADAKQRQMLEAILHPQVFQVIQQQLNQLPTNIPYCVLSIPLLLETQRMELVDRILVVDCPLHIQRQRLIEHRGLSFEEIEQIFSVQVSREVRLAIANDVIYNESSLDNLQQQVLKLHQQYLNQQHCSCQ